MPTYNALLLAPSVSLPAGVENYAGECRLATQYPFSGGDLEFDQQTSGSDPSGYTVARPTGPTVDLGLSRKNRFTMRGTFGVYPTIASMYRQIVGDFDVFCQPAAQFTSDWFASLACGDSGLTDSTKIVTIQFVSSSTVHNLYTPSASTSVTDGMNTGADWSRTPIWYRLSRSGTTFTAYYRRGRTPAPWTALGSPASVAAVSSTTHLGQFASSATGSPAGHVEFSPIWNWPPFLTSSPQIVKEYDSGVNATQWNLATFAERLLNDPREYATAADARLYSYVASDATGTAFAQTDRTLSQVQAGGTITGRYLRLGVKLPSDGLQDTRWNGATVNVTAGAAAGGVSYSRVFGGL